MTESFAAISGESARRGGGVNDAGRDASPDLASFGSARGAKIGGSGSTGWVAFGLGLGCATTNDTPQEAK